jgi:membrane-bound lytic murein transglycosylase B
MLKPFFFICAIGFSCVVCPEVRADYSRHPEAAAFIAKMVGEHKFDPAIVTAALAKAEKKQMIIDAISKPAEKTKPWYEYRKIFLDQARIDQGVEFWRNHKDELRAASKLYDVDTQIIVAILGVETRYGRNMGNYRVLDALTTLGFDYPPRSAFFREQLVQLFLLAREQKLDILQMKGSYAGAMGYGQFIPSSYRSFAVDGDKDGIADIWSNSSDAIFSVAKYFNAHGWQFHQPILALAKTSGPLEASLVNTGARPQQTLAEFAQKGVTLPGKINKKTPVVLLSYEQMLGPEYWLGFNNFYVITRYNRSPLYAMAVWQLSNEIVSAYKKSKHRKTIEKK